MPLLIRHVLGLPALMQLQNISLLIRQSSDPQVGHWTGIVSVCTAPENQQAFLWLRLGSMQAEDSLLPHT